MTAAYSVADDYVCYRPAWKEKGWPFWKILRSWTTSRRVARLKKYGTGNDLLEVGCGAGDFLVAAHTAGWKVRSVEFNSSMAEILRNERGLDVHVGELELGLWKKEEIDVVVFWNVLEHVPDPGRDLIIAASYLRPGGVVLLNIPSRQAAEHGRWFGECWALLDIPRHLYFFDKSTLAELLRKAGLDLVTYKTPFEQTAWCYYMSSWNWAARSRHRFAQWSKFLLLSGFVTLMLPLIAAQSLRGRGVEAFAVGRKAKT